MKLPRNKKITIAVHDGNFHPDDVFSVATLSIYFKGKIRVLRSRDKNIYSKADFVVDVGDVYDPSKNRFDHHQEGHAGFRNKDISYSSFGLVWKEYGEKVCGSKKVADIIDTKLVAVVDADDCGFNLFRDVVGGFHPLLMTDVIYSLRPTWREDDSNINKIFLKTVAFAKHILLREIKVAKDRAAAFDFVDDVYQQSKDKRVIVFDKVHPPKSLLANYPEPIYAVYPNRGQKMWRVITIEEEEKSFKVRLNFPKSWWGKTGDDFVNVSGVDDAIFCRNGGIFVGAESKEGAIKLAEQALKLK